MALKFDTDPRISRERGSLDTLETFLGEPTLEMRKFWPLQRHRKKEM